MARRMVFMLVAMFLFIGAIGFIKFTQIRTAMAQGAAWAPPPEAVTTVIATREEWPATLSAIGSVTAVHGVTVSADLPGVVDRIAFESGRAVGKGDLLVQLDTSQEEAQLQSALAEEHLAELNFGRMRDLLARGVTSQAEFDRTKAELDQAKARVVAARATIDRKTIRAPFSGVLGIRQVDLGQYMNAGDPVVPLQSLDPVYVNFAIPQQEISRLRPGSEVHVRLDETGSGAARRGTITALNSVVDEATRNIQLQATFENEDGTLRPGMFVEVEVQMGTADVVVALPGSAVAYAPYGNSVFIVEDMKGPDGRSFRGVRQEFVKLGAARGDQVAVISGVTAGEEVVTSGVFKLRNGAAVQVNNEVQPANNAAPRPEDS